MTVRGAFDKALKPGGKMPKGKPYHDKSARKAEKKGGKKEMVKKPPPPRGRKVPV
jgi:hypothetical protein